MFFGYCRGITQTLDDRDREFSSRVRGVRSIVRVAVSSNMAQHVIVPSLPERVARHPGSTIDFLVNDALADMSRDGIDIATRAGSTQTDAVVSKQISSHGRRLYASPMYLKKHGKPKHPDDRVKHRIITTRAAPRLNDWPFIIDGKSARRPMHGQRRQLHRSHAHDGARQARYLSRA